MNEFSKRLLRAAACSAMLAAAAASCTTDEIEPGPVAVDAGITGPDSQGEDQVAPPAATVGFKIEVAGGDALVGTVTHAALTLDKDKNTAVKAFQVNVVVTTENVADNSAVVVKVDGGGSFNAVITGDAARIDDVTLPCAPNQSNITVTVTPAAGAAVQAIKTFTLACDDQCVVEIEQLVNCLTSDQDPGTAGFQQPIKVTSKSAGCDTVWLEITDIDGATISTKDKATNLGQATEATLTATLATVTTGIVSKQATIVAHASDSQHVDRPAGASAPLVVKITTDKPEIGSLQPAAGTLNLANDDDKDPANGINIVLTGTATTLTPADIDAIVIEVGGQTLKTKIDVTGKFSQPLAFTTSGEHTVKVTATNSCGLSETVELKYSVFVAAAALVITKPLAKAVLLAKDDQDLATATVYDTNIEVGVTAGSDGATVAIWCRQNEVDAPFGAAPVGTAKYTGGAATLTIPVKLDTAANALGTDVACEARDDAPNPATSAEVAFQIGLPAPCLKVSQPVDGLATKAASLSVTTEGANLDGAKLMATLTKAGQDPIGPTAIGTIQNGGFSGAMSLLVGAPPKMIPDGEYTLALDAVDVFGNKAADSACSEVTRKIVLDTTAPTIKLTAPTATTLDPLVHADVSAAPGYQIDIDVEVMDEAAGAVVTVCLMVGTFKVDPCLKTGASNKLTFPAVTLSSGNNDLVFTATDPVGNTSTSAATTLNLKNNAVKVQWVQPTQATAVAVDSVVAKIAVAESEGAKPITGAKIELFVNDSTQAYANVTVSEGAAGVYTLTISGLVVGANKLVVGATPQSGTGQGFGPPLVVTYKTTKPTIVVDAPKDGTVLNGTAAACLAGSEDCITDVVATTTDASDGAAAELSIACGPGKAVTAAAPVAGGKATFKQVTLLNNKKCVLSAKVTDEAGQSASSTDVTVTVDRSGPVFGELKVPLSKLVLGYSDLDGNPDNGMQTEVAVFVGGVPETSTVTLSIFDDDGKLHSSPKVKAFQAVPDGKLGVLTWGAVNLPDGKNIKLSFEAVDPVGNSTKKDFILEVISAQADVRITGPAMVANTACTVSSDCSAGGVCGASGACSIGWGKATKRALVVATFGLPENSTVRICSDNSAAKGSACATAGHKEVLSVKVGLGATEIDLSSVADGDHHLVAEAQAPGSDPVDPKAWAQSTKTPSAAVRERYILIDTIAPTLVTCLPPKIAGVPDGCLSAKSQAVLDNVAGGTFSFAVTSQAAGDQVVAYDDNGNKASAATSANKLAAVSLTMAEGNAKVSAQAADVVGNVSAVLDCGKFEVNTVAPTAKFLAPAQSPLLAADKDKLDVVISSGASDVEGQPVALKDGAKPANSVAFKSGQVTFAHSLYKVLEDGDHTLTATVQDSCGNTAIIGTVPALLTVDTLPPTVGIEAPLAAAVFGDAQDADKNVGGYQVSTTFSCGGASEWSLELGRECDKDFANCSSFNKIASDSVANPGGNEPAQTMTIPFGQTDFFVARVTCIDTHGNTTALERGFQVTLSGCLVSLTGLAGDGVVNTTKCAKPGTDCASVELTTQVQFVGPCGNVSAIKLYRDDVETQSAAPTNDGASFKSTYKHTEAFKLEAKVLVGADVKGASGPTQVVVDLENPKVSFVATKVLGFDTPASGATVLWPMSADQDELKTKHQFHASLKVEDVALKGGKLTELVYDTGAGQTQALGATGLVTPVTFSEAAVAQIEVKYATIPENATGQVRATVTDAAGNVGTTSFTVTADWVAPAKVAIDALTDNDLNPRRPYAVLNFKAVADNGGSGKAAASYEVRYSRKAITDEATFAAACDAKSLAASAVGTPADPGQADKVMIEGPDPRASADVCKFAPLLDNGATEYHFAVRAVDAAGNKGPISDEVSTDKLALRFAKINGSGAFADQYYWRYTGGLGDINGDGKADAGFSNRTGGFCIVYGNADAGGAVADLTVSAATGDNHDCWSDTKSVGQQLAAPVDVNGDGVDDLVLAYGSKVTGNIPASQREVRIYLGEKGKKIGKVAAVTVTNLSHTLSRGVRALAAIGNFNGDKSAGGTPLGDIAFTSTATLAEPYERVFILPGSETWSTAKPISIDIESASDRAANNMAVIHRNDSTGSPLFGVVLAAGGNILLDGAGQGAQFDELLIGQYSGPTHSYIVKGQALQGETIFALSNNVSGSGPADGKVVGIFPAGTGTTNFANPVAVSFDGDTVGDLAIQHASTNEQGWLYWIRGKDLQSKLGKAVTLFGKAVAGMPDLASTDYGYRAKSNALNLFAAGNFADQTGAAVALMSTRAYFAPGGDNAVLVRLPQKRQGAGDDPGYHALDLNIGDPLTPGTKGIGSYRLGPVGDFNGDGYPDMLTATPSGYALLIY